MVGKNIVFLILFIASSVFGQQSKWVLTLENGEQVTNFVLHDIDQSSLIVLRSGPFRYIPISDIVELRNDKSELKRTYKTVLTWCGIGMFTGAFTSAMSGEATRANRPPPPPPQYGDPLIGDLDFGVGFDAMAGGVVGGLAGLLVGSIVYNRPIIDEVYSFKNVDDAKKRKILLSIIKKEQKNRGTIFG